MYKLFYSPAACSLAPHILLEDIGAEYELILTSIKEGATNSSSYLKINPKGRVPALSVNGELLTEAPAILMYLSQTHKDKNLLPNTTMELARCYEWFNYLSTTVHTLGYGQFWRPVRLSDDEACYPSIIEKGTKNIESSYAYIDSLLGRNEWAVGDSYTCVDPYLFVFYRWGKLIGIDMQPFKNWCHHAERMTQRGPVQKALEQEGLDP